MSRLLHEDAQRISRRFAEYNDHDLLLCENKMLTCLSVQAGEADLCKATQVFLELITLPSLSSFLSLKPFRKKSGQALPLKKGKEFF